MKEQVGLRRLAPPSVPRSKHVDTSIKKLRPIAAVSFSFHVSVCVRQFVSHGTHTQDVVAAGRGDRETSIIDCIASGPSQTKKMSRVHCLFKCTTFSQEM
jgi:hypothetical protein